MGSALIDIKISRDAQEMHIVFACSCVDLRDTSQTSLDQWLATIGNNRIIWSLNLKNIGPDGLAKNRIVDDGQLKEMKKP